MGSGGTLLRLQNALLACRYFDLLTMIHFDLVSSSSDFANLAAEFQQRLHSHMHLSKV